MLHCRVSELRGRLGGVWSLRTLMKCLINWLASVRIRSDGMSINQPDFNVRVRFHRGR